MLKTQKINQEDITYYQLNQNLTDVLLLVHGNMGSWKSWREVYPLLKDFRIIAVNLRGFGQSSTKQSLRDLQPFADDIIKLCELKNLTNITINGWSFGGLVSMKVAEMKPTLVKKIILTNAVGHTGYHLKDAEGKWISDEDFLKSEKMQIYQQILINKNEQVLRGIFDTMLFTCCKEVQEQRKKEMCDMSFQQRNTYHDTFYVLVKSKVDLSKINAKWLIIVGAKDNVVPYYIIEPTIEFLKSSGADVKVMTIEEGAHMAPMQVPERYSQAVRQFALEQK